VTWDQVVIWLIVPAIVAIVIGGGGGPAALSRTAAISIETDLIQ